VFECPETSSKHCKPRVHDDHVTNTCTHSNQCNCKVWLKPPVTHASCQSHLEITLVGASYLQLNQSATAALTLQMKLNKIC